MIYRWWRRPDGSAAESPLVNWNVVRGWLGMVIRLVLGVVWLWAGWSKVRDPLRFVQAVRAYDATPEWLSQAIAYGLPVLELCLGVVLIIGIAVRMSAIASAALVVVFMIGTIQAAARGLKLDCGCFGGGGQTLGPTHYTLDLLREIVMLALAAYLIVWPRTRVSLAAYLARNDYVEPPSAKRLRSEAGARKYSAQVEARNKRAHSRALWVNSSLALIVVLVTVIGIGVQANRAKITGDVTATNASVTNGIVFGKAAPATIDVFYDYQCPNCLTLEQGAHSALETAARAGKVQLRFHPVAFLDASSNGNDYSTRAANAALCASDISVDMFLKYHDILFGNDSSGKQVQPAEGSNGRSDTELISYAKQAGMTPAQVTTFTTCVQNQQHKALVQAMTENASKRGVVGTPTVKVNGKEISSPDLAKLQAAIDAAVAKAPPVTPSVTPKATPTPTPSGTASLVSPSPTK